MTDIINPVTAEITQVTIAERALGDKPADVCIDPRDELVTIDMTKLATDTTPYTDIEAEMAKAKQPAQTTAILEEPATCRVCSGTIERGKKASIVPGGFIHYRTEPCQRTLEREHAERSRNTPTTPEFMDILNEISFQQFMASIPRVLCLPEPKPTKTVVAKGKKSPQSNKIEWTVASTKQWLEQREEITRTAFENAKIDKKRATADDIRNVCHAITALGGPRYPYLIDELNCVRILERNTDEKLVDMLKTLNRKLWNMYASHAKAALGDDGTTRRL